MRGSSRWIWGLRTISFVLDSLSLSLFMVNQFESLERAIIVVSMTSWVLQCLTRAVVLSAWSIKLNGRSLTIWKISLIQTVSKIGPKIEPYGTSNLTIEGFEMQLHTFTCCVLSRRQHCSQENRVVLGSTIFLTLQQEDGMIDWMEHFCQIHECSDTSCFILQQNRSGLGIRFSWKNTLSLPANNFS